MARVSIPITQLTDAGVAQPAQTASDAANGHSLLFNDGRVIVEVQNTNAAAKTVTFETPATVGGFAVADNTVSIPNGATLTFGPFAPSVYNQADGSVWIDVEISTDLKFRAYRV
jgi:hypothetical protein